jgi:hypothetical protein
MNASEAELLRRLRALLTVSECSNKGELTCRAERKRRDWCVSCETHAYLEKLDAPRRRLR